MQAPHPLRHGFLSRALAAASLACPLVLAGSCTAGPGPAPAPPAPSGGAAVLQAQAVTGTAGGIGPEAELARAVEIRRTSYGVPHVLGETLESAAFGMAWVMMEDYREEVLRQLLVANGRWAVVSGRLEMEGDYPGRMAHDFAVQVFPGFPEDVKEILRGFASGVNYFIRLRAPDLPEWATPEFTPEDVAAKDLQVWSQGAVRDLLRWRSGSAPQEMEEERPDPDVGSNAWAFGPGRTRSGKAILVRNPHLSYTSGYYEAHITVPGVLNFYGDFRLGGPFGIIGGFNERLGWSTTNNYGEPDQIYAVLRDPDNPDAFLFEGTSHSIETRSVTAEFAEENTYGSETRNFRFTSLGPVLLETPDTLFVLKTATLGQHRLGEQWLRMMQSRNLEEWKEAMRIRAKYSSNFTYADADGNIFLVWNASIPILPHEPSNGAPVFAAGVQDVWTELYPWDSLPQLLNPRGGYVQNANDPPYYTNLNEPLRPEDYPPNFPEPRLRFRSQSSLELVHTDRVLSLEEVVDLKHSTKMILADRVLAELLRAVRTTSPMGDEAAAIDLLAEWDHRTDRESRGATLFELWARRYFSITDPDRVYLHPWSVDDPTLTPRGLGDESKAVEAFRWAVAEATRRFESWDVAWGEVHRIRAGTLDIAVGGCPSDLGCFRTIGFAEDEDGKYRARTGDAWILAVEFGEIPRALSVLVYGNSLLEDSPYFYNQAELFANHQVKSVAFTEKDIQKDITERYHPGEEHLF